LATSERLVQATFRRRPSPDNDGAVLWLWIAASTLNAGQAGQISGTELRGSTDTSDGPAEATAYLSEALLKSGFVWVDQPSCSQSDDLGRCLAAAVPTAAVGMSVAVDSQTRAVIVTVWSRNGQFLDRFRATSDRKSDLADLVDRVRRFLFEGSRLGDRAAGTVAFEGAPAEPLDVSVDAVRLGTAEAEVPLLVTGLGPGRHELRFRGSRYHVAPVGTEVVPGERITLPLRQRKLRSLSRVFNLSLSAAALGGGATMVAVGYADAPCDLVLDTGPAPDRCPDALRPDVDLRVPGWSVAAFGLGLGLSELLLPRRFSGWIPWMFGLGAGAIAAGVSAAVVL
jgi:hypothetical protein